MGSNYLDLNVVKNANFRGLRRIYLRVFGHIARDYGSAAEATELRSEVPSLAIIL